MVKVYVGNNVTRRPVMVSDETTLRKVLEDNQIDYSLGMTTLDGATLAAGELDKTFKDFGISETCYLMNTAKAVNAAAGIKVIGNRAFVESDFTPEELREVAKYRPAALTLVDEETKEPVFSVCMSSGDGSIGKYGAEYGCKNAAGHALISMEIPDGVDAKEYIEEKVGVAILLLRKVEAGLSSKLDEIKAEKDEVLGTIEVL